MSLLPSLAFLCTASFALSAADQSCNHGDNLFDIGLAKVMGMPSFEAFPLEDIRRTFTKIFDFHVRLSTGKLCGLSNLKRDDRSYINATDSGITALFNIAGGPLAVTYTGKVNSILVDARVNVNVYIPWIRLFIYVVEPSPNNLQLARLGFSAGPVTFWADQLDGTSLMFDFLHWLAESHIEKALNDKMGEMVIEVVHQFLGMVELFAKNGTKIGEVKKPREDPAFIPVWFFPESIYHNTNPWQDPSKWGIFDYSVKRMTIASKLDPVMLTDVDDVTWDDWLVHITNVTVDGLGFLRRGGDNYAVADKCGISARVALAMENIKVQIYATTDSPPLRVRIDVRIIGVDLVVKVKETNKTIEIEDYQLNFPIPVEYDVYVLTPVVGPFAELLNGFMRRHLTEEETDKLEDHSRKYLERAIGTVTEFIKDPAAWMPWNTSIIDAYRIYKENHRN
ncbi:uncharacterized protein LOC119384986 [Rhipicephalus sanguineus]|uniref:uncharacterized protein LOC119384986 n=1 Tax=Rhipicephalus sanguineus TaxID=34632 RepID=UPI001893399A|nr:uncharacterized protein LOC119384986 [Rhipicephalus sanguineus]